MCTVKDKDILIDMGHVLVKIVVLSNIAQEVAAAIRIEGKFSIYAVLNHDGGQVHILISLRSIDRAALDQHLRKVASDLRLRRIGPPETP
ncbi:hypothetical protein HON36_02985 [Candidatus Parcubacteria bacterium]|jgi:hypothetical protein|nr:hypothetical protein [Candidatus Parcubacteria bacterium]MBT7227963.1 hypothetical protein [Candidatus Parcubacteria bacterium]